VEFFWTTMTRDPLYWSLAIWMGVFAALFGYFKFEKENLARSGPWCLCMPLYFLAGLVGSAVGALVIGPLLQMAWQWVMAPSREVVWPHPVSLYGMFFVTGTMTGFTCAMAPAFLARRWAVGPKA
jgi:hypothetical protein